MGRFTVPTRVTDPDILAAYERATGQAVVDPAEAQAYHRATSIEESEKEAITQVQPQGAARGVVGLGRGIDNLVKGMQQLYGHAMGDEKLLSDVRFQRSKEDDVYKYGGRVPLGTREGQKFAEIAGETIPFLFMPIKVPGMAAGSTVAGKAAMGATGLGVEAGIAATQAAIPYAEGDDTSYFGEQRAERMVSAARLAPLARAVTSGIAKTGAAAKIDRLPGGQKIPSRMEGKAGEMVERGAEEGIPIGRGRLQHQITGAEAAASARTPSEKLVGNAAWNLDAAAGTTGGKALKTMLGHNNPGPVQKMYRELDGAGRQTFKEAYYANALDKATRGGALEFDALIYATELRRSMANIQAASPAMAGEVAAFSELMEFITRSGRGPSRDALQLARGWPFIWRALSDTVRESNPYWRVANADPRIFSDTLAKIGATPDFQEQLARNFIRTIAVGESISQESGEESYAGGILRPAVEAMEMSREGYEGLGKLWDEKPLAEWARTGGSRSKAGK